MHIPNKLHFYFMESAKQTQQMESVLSWAQIAPHYTFCIWTTQHHIMPYYETVLAVLRDRLEIDPVLPNDLLGLNDTTNSPQVIIQETHLGMSLVVSTSRGFDLTIEINDVKRLYYKTTTATLYTDERFMWKNKRAAEVFMRLWILYNHGGISFSEEVKPITRTLPADIYAPKGILFRMLPSTPPSFSSAVLAAPQESLHITSLSQTLEKMYHTEYARRGFGPYFLTNEGLRRQFQIEQLRSDLSRPGCCSFMEKRRKKKLLSKLLDKQHHRAKEKSDFSVINQWMLESGEFFSSTEKNTEESLPSSPELSGGWSSSLPSSYNAEPPWRMALEQHVDFSDPREEEFTTGYRAREGAVTPESSELDDDFVTISSELDLYSFEAQAPIELLYETEDEFSLL